MRAMRTDAPDAVKRDVRTDRYGSRRLRRRRVRRQTWSVLASCVFASTFYYVVATSDTNGLSRVCSSSLSFGWSPLGFSKISSARDALLQLLMFLGTFAVCGAVSVAGFKLLSHKLKREAREDQDAAGRGATILRDDLSVFIVGPLFTAFLGGVLGGILGILRSLFCLGVIGVS